MAVDDKTYAVFDSGVIESGPGARYANSLIFDQSSGRAILFGGGRPPPHTSPTAETWAYDGIWSSCPGSSCTTHPRARIHAGFAFAPRLNGGVGILFGGTTGPTPLCDTWEWDGAAGTWTERSAPAPCTDGPGSTAARFGHAMEGFEDRVALFGGYVRSGSSYPPTAELLVWDGNAWSELCDADCVQRSGRVPAARGDATLTHVVTPSHDALFLYGGRAAGSYRSDLWEFDLQDERWIERCTAPCVAPEPRGSHGAVFDPIRKKIYVRGGCTNELNDCLAALPTLEYDPELDAWSPIPASITPSAPDAKRWFAIAYLATRGRILEFGGDSAGYFLGETVEYYTRGSTCVSDAECHTGVCARKAPGDATGICAEPCASSDPDNGTGPCVDGFRCNEACDQPCKTCFDVPGVCTPVHDRADDRCTGNDTCNSSGECRLALGQACLDGNACASGNCAVYGQHVCSVPGCGVQPCVLADAQGSCVTAQRGASFDCAGHLTCDDDGTCLEVCAADADCAPEYYCDAENGTCTPGKRYGDTCASSEECARGAPCVDGVCCQTDCSGACEKCGAGGLCETLPEGAQPLPPRQPCSGSGVCAGYCPGNGASCVYPGIAKRCEKLDCPTLPEKECKTSCDHDSITEWTCDGLGECVEALSRDCGVYTCRDGDCLKGGCNDHTQCRAGATCDRLSQGCVPVRRGCASKYQIELHDGSIVDCDGYLCIGDNQCSQVCNNNDQCAEGYACEERECVPRPGGGDAAPEATTPDGADAGDAGAAQSDPVAQPAAPDDGCATAPRGYGFRGSIMIALGLLTAARRRRRLAARATAER